MNKNIIPIFVINLPKDVERKSFMEEQMNTLELPFEFIEGKDGNDPEVISSCDDALAIKEHGKVLMSGEKGCAFSHRLIYEKMIKENIPYAFILEDDAVLPENIKAVLQEVIQKNNRSWEWLSFDYPKIGLPFVHAWIYASWKMIKKNPFFIVYALIKFPFIVVISFFEIARDFLARYISVMSGPKIFYRPLYNAGAYIITIEGIKKMMPLLKPLRFSADRTPNQARIKTGLNMRWYVPRIVHQSDEDFGNKFISNTIS